MDHITSDPYFKTTDLTKLTSKDLQLNTLQSLQSYTSSSFKLLLKQKDTLKTLLRDMQPVRNQSMSLGIQGSDTIPNEDTTSQNVNFQNGPGQNYAYNHGPLVAERTLQHCNPINSSSNTQHFPIKVKTRLYPDTGIPHPYDESRDFLSRFPLGFRGCYYCGNTDHFRTRDCPAAKNGNFNKMQFFQEMWLHKPHTKKHDYGPVRQLLHDTPRI